MEADLKILIVEDNETDADLLRRELKKSGLHFTSKIVETRQDYEYSLENFNPDIILSDYSLPAFDAATAFRIKQNRSPHIPFIIVSGIIGEENAVELIKIGVTDYSPKDKLFALIPKISRALKEAEERKEKKIIDEKLKSQAAELIILNQELEERVASRTKALGESEKRFRNMIESIPQIAWTGTVEGEVTFYNKRWYDYTGLDYEHTKADGWRVVIHPDDLEFTLEQNRLIRASRVGGEFQNRKLRTDGVYLWHLIRLEPFKNEADEEPLWVGTATDINDLKLLQQQKDDFISIASHELKTPITSLKATIQLLDLIKDNPPPAMLPKLVELATKSLNNVSKLVDELLNAGELNDGRLHLNLKQFILSKLISECCHYVRVENKYTIVMEGDMELQAHADAERINQIVVNLVNNAIKYAPESKEIRINIEKVNDVAKVSITDKGPGISADKIPHLFDRYYKGYSGGIHTSGFGLGLYICAEIIKKHKGQIGITSELGKGSTFWFTLPLT